MSAPTTRRIEFIAVAVIATLLIVVFPLLNSTGVISNFTLNLWGKYLCYALLAISVDLLWGYTGDKWGFRLVLLLALVMWVAATLLLIENHAPWAIFTAFFGLGASQSGYAMGAQTMILEFGHRDDLPMRIALSTTAEAITATLGPLAGGWVADLLGYNLVFGVSIGFVAAALLLLAVAVKEPRIARLA